MSLTPHILRCRLGAIVVCATIAAFVGSVQGATSGTVIGAIVPSATQLDVSGCLPGIAGRTNFGTVLPGSPAVTSTDCTVVFGSSNNGSSLRVAQPDGVTDAMYRPTDGNPDTTFGGDGFATTDDVNWSTTLSGAFAADGSLYLVGRASSNNAIAHISTTGARDGAFGVAGHALVTMGGASGSDYETPDLFVLADGTMLLSSVANFGGVARAFVAKFDAAGLPVGAFGGGDGIVEVPGAGTLPAIPHHAMLLPDGGVLLAGSNGINVVTARITAAGLLDTAWGDGGTRVLTPTLAVRASYGDAAMDNLGRIVLVGDLGVNMGAMRLTADGRIDTTFDTDGVATATFPGATGGEAYAVGIQPSGRIVMAGEAYYADVEYAAAALLPTGAPDLTWGTNGTFSQDVGPYGSQGYGSRVGKDGRVYMAGLVVQDAGNTGDLLVLDSEGDLDLTFSSNGHRELQHGDNVNWSFEAMDVIESDQGIAVVGWGDYYTWKFTHARVPDYADASFDWNDGTGAFGVCLASAGTATAVWPTTGTCPASDGTNWRAVPRRTFAAGATAASRAAAGTSTVALRFGVRMSSAQAPGIYTAPIAFEVTAP